MADAEDEVDKHGEEYENADDDGPVRLVVVPAVPHDDAIPPHAVHRPRVPEHAARDDGIRHAHAARGPVVLACRVEEREREGREEERDAEP